MTEGGENQNPEKSVWLPTKPQNIPGPKINPKHPMPSFRALKTAAAELRGLAELRGRDTQVLPRIFRLF